jgi:hypothetical protein
VSTGHPVASLPAPARAGHQRWWPRPRLIRPLRPPILVRLLRLAIAVVILVSAGPSVVYLRDSLDPSQARLKDVGQDILLAHAVADGANPYVPVRDLAAQYLPPAGYLNWSHPSPHPPSVGVFFLPFVLLNYADAVRVWFGVQLISLVAGVGLVIQGAGLPLRQRWTPIVAFALLSWLSVTVDLGIGQMTTVLLALIAATQLALSRGHTSLAGGLLGISLLLKPLMWPWILVLAWQRQWRAVAVTVVVVLAGFSAPGLRVGFGAILSYVTQVLPAVSALYATEPTNISLWTVGPRLFQSSMPELSRLVGVGVPAVVVLCALVWLRRRPSLETALGVTTCVSVVVNPISWQYYVVLVLLPAAHVVRWLHAHRYPRVPTILAAAIGIALYQPGGEWRELARLLSSPWVEPGQPLPPLAGLVTLGPALSTAALGLLLAWLSPRMLIARPARANDPEIGKCEAETVGPGT